MKLHRFIGTTRDGATPYASAGLMRWRAMKETLCRRRSWETATPGRHGDLCSPRFHGFGKNLGVHSMG